MLPDQEYDQHTVYISANMLRKGEELDDQALAARLSEAIIEAVNREKDKHWEMTKMDFNSGEVTIHFRRPKGFDPKNPYAHLFKK